MANLLGSLSVDPASDRAVFRQIADQLRALIRDGHLASGDQLPSEAQLMDQLGVARMTVRHALELLEREGLTRAEHGRGVFVRSRPPVRRLASDRFARRHRKEGMAAFIAESEQVGARPEVDMIKVAEINPPADIAGRLKYGGSVIVRSRRYSLDGRPVETATSYIPADLRRGTPIAEPNPGPGGIYAPLHGRASCSCGLYRGGRSGRLVLAVLALAVVRLVSLVVLLDADHGDGAPGDGGGEDCSGARDGDGRRRARDERGEADERGREQEAGQDHGEEGQGEAGN